MSFTDNQTNSQNRAASSMEATLTRLLEADAGLIEMMKSLRTTGEWTYKTSTK
jgi:hypothetical protein